MKIRFIVDNNTKSDLMTEWGLAVYIEHNNHKYLLDTGSSDLFLKNAKDMNINISEMEYGILSHAHYDHSDGMDTFFEKNSKASFYLRKDSKENCYSKEEDGEYRYIGIKKGILSKYKDRIKFVDGDYEIENGVYLIPHKTDNLELIGEKSRMYLKENEKYIPDNFYHEQSLVFDTNEGLVIFNSCSHGGADNIIKEIKQTFPSKKIAMLIGGFHLFETNDEDVKALALRIKNIGISKIYTGHCTGEKALKILQEELPGVVNAIYTGLEIEVE